LGPGLGRAESGFCSSLDQDSAMHPASQGPVAALVIRPAAAAASRAKAASRHVASGWVRRHCGACRRLLREPGRPPRRHRWQRGDPCWHQETTGTGNRFRDYPDHSAADQPKEAGSLRNPCNREFPADSARPCGACWVIKTGFPELAGRGFLSVSRAGNTKGTSKNPGSTRSVQRHSLRQLERMEPQANQCQFFEAPPRGDLALAALEVFNLRLHQPARTSGHCVNGHCVNGHCVNGHCVSGHCVSGHCISGHDSFLEFTFSVADQQQFAEKASRNLFLSTRPARHPDGDWAGHCG
jgi:hypothetical protein